MSNDKMRLNFERIVVGGPNANHDRISDRDSRIFFYCCLLKER